MEPHNDVERSQGEQLFAGKTTWLMALLRVNWKHWKFQQCNTWRHPVHKCVVQTATGCNTHSCLGRSVVTKSCESKRILKTWGQMKELQSPRPLNSPSSDVPPSLFLKLRLLLEDQFTVFKYLCCSFPIGYSFGICHPWKIHWGYFTWHPKAVLCCRSVQIPLWGCLCRRGVQNCGCSCPHALTITQIQDLKHLPGGVRVRGPAAVDSCGPWLSPQHGGDCHCCGVQCHRGPFFSFGPHPACGKNISNGRILVCASTSSPLIAHK